MTVCFCFYFVCVIIVGACIARQIAVYTDNKVLSYLILSSYLIVCFGDQSKRDSVTKQRLSKKMDTIAMAYTSVGQVCPIGIRAHLTRGMALSGHLIDI